MTAFDNTVAISRTVSAFRFFNCVNMLNDSSSTSCSIPRDAVVQNSLVMCIGDSPKKNSDSCVNQFAHSYTRSAVLAMGEERTGTSAKLSGANLAFLDELQHALWPYHTSRSSLIDSMVTIVRLQHRAGKIELTPAALQENVRNLGNDSMGTEPRRAVQTEIQGDRRTRESAHSPSPAMETVPLPPQSIHPSSKKRLA